MAAQEADTVPENGVKKTRKLEDFAHAILLEA